jgi:hypothetical protein
MALPTNEGIEGKQRPETLYFGAIFYYRFNRKYFAALLGEITA